MMIVKAYVNLELKLLLYIFHVQEANTNTDINHIQEADTNADMTYMVI